MSDLKPQTVVLITIICIVLIAIGGSLWKATMTRESITTTMTEAPKPLAINTEEELLTVLRYTKDQTFIIPKDAGMLDILLSTERQTRFDVLLINYNYTRERQESIWTNTRDDVREAWLVRKCST